jgi:uncharacterized protein YqhQ
MSKDEFLSVGGQAIVEGVMMRSPKYFTVACRAPNKELVIKTEPIEKTWIGRQKWLKIPFLRGSWALLDAMTLGIRAMRYASDVQLAEEYQPVPTDGAKVDEGAIAEASDAETVSAAGEPKAKPVMNKRIQEGVITGTIIFSLAFGLFLFKYLPQLGGTTLRTKFNLGPRETNLIVEFIKAFFFIGYLLAISQLEGVKEVFKYHGAEHKAINVYEKELPLTIENCRAQTRLHPRCGTSFAIIVLLLGFLIFPFIPRFEDIYTQFKSNMLLISLGNFVMHVAVLPFIAGIAYELLRFAGKFRDNKVVMSLFVPGLLTQYITTKEPRDDQIEVALESLKACLAEEESAKAIAAS